MANVIRGLVAVACLTLPLVPSSLATHDAGCAVRQDSGAVLLDVGLDVYYVKAWTSTDGRRTELYHESNGLPGLQQVDAWACGHGRDRLLSAVCAPVYMALGPASPQCPSVTVTTSPSQLLPSASPPDAEVPAEAPSVAAPTVTAPTVKAPQAVPDFSEPVDPYLSADATLPTLADPQAGAGFSIPLPGIS